MKVILFQFNIAKMKAPFDDDIWSDFKDQLDEIHTQAEKHPGFVWRMKGEDFNAGYIQPYPRCPLIMGNMSAWKSYKDLEEFTFSGQHLEIMKKRKKWFDPLPRPWNVLYYSRESDITNFSEEKLIYFAKCRLRLLESDGDGQLAFGFKKGLS